MIRRVLQIVGHSVQVVVFSFLLTHCLIRTASELGGTASACIITAVATFWLLFAIGRLWQLLRPAPPAPSAPPTPLEEDRPQGAYRAPGGVLPPEAKPVYDKIWEADLGGGVGAQRRPREVCDAPPPQTVRE